MQPGLRVRHVRSDALDLFLALYREVAGRFSWETSVLTRPVRPEVAAFRDGLRYWREGGQDELPRWLAVATPADLLTVAADDRVRQGTGRIVAAISAAEADLRAALEALEPVREQAVRVVDERLRLDGIAPVLAEALGTGKVAELRLHSVLLAPLPSAGFLADNGSLDAGYVDCRRHRGSTLVECVLALVGWKLLRETRDQKTLIWQIASRLPGKGPYHRRLRAVLAKILLEMTCGELVRQSDREHRPGVDVLGSAWRFPRLYGAAVRHWAPYLAGATGRTEALDSLAAEVGAYGPRWFVDYVDAASLAADFYLMEYLVSAGDRACALAFARWLPRLASDLAGQVDLVIGTELGHFERALDVPWPDPMASFLRQVTTGDSQSAWPQARSALGAEQALDLAWQAFSGPGTEFGGAAWAPIAAMKRDYCAGRLPASVFIDQCFTLQHNNGCVFDKCFDVNDMQAVLDAQAAGDLDMLSGHASAWVRRAWQAHRAEALAGYDPSWLAQPGQLGPVAPDPVPGWLDLAVNAARPGGLGCGSALLEEDCRAGHGDDLEAPVGPRQAFVRRPPLPPLDRYGSALATITTPAGPISLVLFTEAAPYTVDNFVKLATGRREWTDPATRERRAVPFYDGTAFHRQIAGYLIQAGDRTGTGQGGPGYRLPDEPQARLPFDRPFLLGMANLGRDGTGSQFFITVTEAPHLSGEYTVFGEVTDARSREIVTAVARSLAPVPIDSVTVEVTSADDRQPDDGAVMAASNRHE
jgi:cyclophilin family peptidyl-prolyl cis-trans isomerase